MVRSARHGYWLCLLEMWIREDNDYIEKFHDHGWVEDKELTFAVFTFAMMPYHMRERVMEEIADYDKYERFTWMTEGTPKELSKDATWFYYTWTSEGFHQLDILYEVFRENEL